VIPAWSFAVPLGLVVLFLSLARRQVRVANESYWRRAVDARPVSSNVVRRSAARVDASHGAARDDSPDASADGGISASDDISASDGGISASDDTNAQSRQPGDARGDDKRRQPGDGQSRDPEDDEPTVPLPAEQLAVDAGGLSEQRVVAIAVPTADGGSLWDPLPITLPTYVDKPVVKRSVRKIAIGEAGTWSAGHSAGAGEQMAQTKPDAQDDVEPDAGQVAEGDPSPDSHRAANA
ncbi:MAG: hypothetical protein H0V07_12005, partial [Propionibacteriales bacterium]|nr:hypothetical protein [Propionibacteriales bacterium]